VIEHVIESQEQEISYLKTILEKNKEGTVGILAKTHHSLIHLREALKEYKNAHIITMSESQGVEFDVVCIVGITENTFNIHSNQTNQNYPEEHKREKERIQKDLLYVALTRAISELHIIGNKKLSELL